MDYRWLVLCTIVAITAFALRQIKTHAYVDNSIEAFASKTTEHSDLLERFRDEFGRDDVFLVIVEGDVFSLPFLQKLAQLTVELESIQLDLPTLGQRKIDRDIARGRLPASARDEWEKEQRAQRLPKPARVDPDASATTGGAATGSADAMADDFADMDADFAEIDDEFSELDEGFDTEGAESNEGWGDEEGGTVIDEVISLVNVSQIRGQNGDLQVGELMDPMPTTPEEVEVLRDTVLGNPDKQIPPDDSLIGQVVSADGRYTGIAVRTQFMAEPDSEKVNDRIREILSSLESEGFRTHVAGPPALAAALNRMLLHDLRSLFLYAMIALGLVLVVMFRSVTGAFAPILVVAVSAIWAFALMFSLDMPMTMISNILPAFFICVGVADSVHVQSVYRGARSQGVDNRESIVYAIEQTGVPVFFTSLTTAMGLLSFQAASVNAIGEMGLTGAFGVGMAFLQTVFLLPILLSFYTTGQMGASPSGERDPISRFLTFCNGLSMGPRRTKNLLIATGLTFVAVYGASTLRVWHNPLSWVPADKPIRVAADTADEHLGGTANVQVLIDTPTYDGVKDLELLQGLERLEEHIYDYRQPETGDVVVGKVMSLLDVLRESHLALEGSRELPADQGKVNDLFTMFGNQAPDDTKRLMTLDGSVAQMSVRLRWLDAGSYGPLSAHIESGIEEFIPPDKATIKTTGSMYNLLSTVGALLMDMIRSFTLAFVLISLLMVLMLGSVKLACIAMAPNLLPIAYIMGYMGYMDIPIDMANLLIASIALGIAVDDTIHLLHHFKLEYNRSGDVERAIEYALQHAGRAIVVTSLILSAGFFVYLSAEMYSLQRFGMLIGMTVVTALLLDLIVTPALLRTFYKSTSGGTDEKAPAPLLTN